MTQDETATVTIEVQNTGGRDGDEIVQMYITDDYASMTRPVKELRGFQRIHLKAGEKRTVSFTIDKELLSFYDADFTWRCEPGTFTISVGASSLADDTIVLRVE